MTEELRIPKDVADDMIAHCVRSRPNEACGVLATHEGSIVKGFDMSNAAASPVRYALDPKEQFEVYRKIEESGWTLGGVYHSHTRTEAYPSPTDVRRATEDVPYVIVSLASEPPTIRAYRISKDNWTDEDGEITEIVVVVG